MGLIPEPLQLVDGARHRILHPAFPAVPGLVAGFTTRQRRPYPDAPWQDDWTFRGPAGVASSSGFHELTAEILPPGIAIATEQQVHGTTIATLPAIPSPAMEPYPATDGLIASVPGWALVGQSADCCIALLIEPERRLAALFHAGWRGTVAGLPQLMIETLQSAHQIDPGKLWIALGPSIQPASYQVGAEVYAALGDAAPQTCVPDEGVPEKYRFDLPGAVALQLLEAGVPAAQLLRSERDTFAEPTWFHSYRREGAGQGLQVGYVGFTEDV